MPILEKLFCTESCKRANASSKNRGLLKFVTIMGVCLTFCVNMLGCAVFFYLHFETLYARILFGFYCYFLLVTAITYFRVCFSDPGYVEDKVPMIRSCSVCNKVKPVRSHHCSQCKRCVLKMDHHCPWVANCIGANNYSSFFQLLFVSSVTFTLSVAMFVVSLAQPQEQLGLQLGCIVPAVVVTVVFAFLVVKLLFFHVKLMRSNQTTIEFYENQFSRQMDKKFKPHFDVGARANVKQVLKYPILIILPFKMKSNLPMDGYYTFDPVTGRDYSDKKRESQTSVIDLDKIQQEFEEKSKESSDYIDQPQEVDLVQRSMVKSPDEMMERELKNVSRNEEPEEENETYQQAEEKKRKNIKRKKRTKDKTEERPEDKNNSNVQQGDIMMHRVKVE
ncbi:Palmitoyltransferase [Hexamita inflata]|uniref:Palmitoyltransferase n=1 Tax=Hexamita inflata TaxID=28002 RepID=A0AA86QYN4_9EUKA|nr:Palmitoyltransferase [Hexamita inflata]